MFNEFHRAGVVVFNNDDYDSATNLFLKAIEENPDVSESYFLLGKSYFFCNEISKATDYLKQYVKLANYSSDANVPHAYDLLGQCHDALGNDDDAILYFKTATVIDPECASAWHNMGLLFIKFAQSYLEQDISTTIKLLEEAQTYLRHALGICANNPVFLHSVASWHEKYVEVAGKNKSEHFELAIQYYQVALKTCRQEDTGLINIINDNLTECWAQYGHFFYKAEDYAKALDCYAQTIQLDPCHLVAINQIGMSLFKQGRFPEARKSFSSILKLTNDPQELADAFLNIACTFRMEKSWEEAKEALEKARKLAPTDHCIDEEAEKLKASILQATLIKTPQAMFSTHTVQQTDTPAEESSTGLTKNP